MQRRDFIGSGATALGGAALLGSNNFAFGRSNDSIKVGLQLYSIRKSLTENPWGTLEDISRLGFTHIEAANHKARTDPGVGFGVGAAELRQRLDDLNLSIVGCHINPLDVAILPRALDYQVELGNKQIGNDIEFFPYGDVDYLKRRCEVFNGVGELARSRGMRFYYHNHFQEFQKFDGNYVYDIIAENTDPSLVFFEMDTYWIYRGGQDPLQWMEKLKDRIVLLHQKDFPREAPQPLNLYDGVIGVDDNIDREVFRANKDPLCFTEIGTGSLPIQSIIDAAKMLPNFEYMMLEQDHTQLSELDSIKTSKEAFLSKFSGIKF